MSRNISSEYYFLKPPWYAQNQVTISYKLISSLETSYRVLTKFLIWPEEYNSVFSDLKLLLKYEGNKVD
jgi:hypothetical protein